jgi:hypothetical protein
MVGSYYNLSEIQLISTESIGSNMLTSKTLQAFEHILKNIVIPPPEPFSSEQSTVSISRPFDKDRNRRRGQKSKDRPSMDWENVRVPAFTPTKIQTKEGIEKQINDFRILLNKISVKNYETQRDLIFIKINEIISLNEDNSETDLEKIASTIFDIASANKFYSDLYADLYVELINKFEIFDDLLDGLLDKYYESLKNIHYIDHNIDYDGFCNYTKMNDLRKAMASFIINLMKKGAIEKEKVLSLILSIQKLLNDYIDSDDRSNEVDEIIENLFLLLTQSQLTLNVNEKWSSNIVPFIQDISKMKSKECKSLSNRAVFKCMDILDNLNMLKN